MANQPRHPIYVRYWPPYYGASRDTPYNLTIEISAASPLLVPFAQLIWPVPLALPYRQYAQSYSSPYALTAVAVAVTYKPSSFDYPLPPTLPRRLPPSYPTPFPLTYQVMPPQWDWFIPRRLPDRVYAQSYSSPYALTAVVVQAQFIINQNDWPLPKRPPIVYAAASGAFIPLLHSIKPPIAQTDWPQPIRPHIVRSTSYGTGSVLLTPAFKPFLLTDWPAPTPPYIVRSVSWGTPTPLLTPSFKPFLQTDWPVPGRAALPTSARTWIQAAIKAVAPLPPSQQDWPLPKRAPIVRAEARRSDIRLLHSIKPPNRQSNWPLPTRPHIVRSTSYGLTAPVIPLVLMSPNHHWPLPSRRATLQLTSGFVRGMVREPPLSQARSQGYIVGG